MLCSPFQLFAVLFFLMLLTLGVGSAAALTSNVITIVCDQFPKWKKVYVTLAVCISGFLIGLVYVTPVRPFRCSRDSSSRFVMILS